jgi:hypothetical protein
MAALDASEEACTLALRFRVWNRGLGWLGNHVPAAGKAALRTAVPRQSKWISGAGVQTRDIPVMPNLSDHKDAGIRPDEMLKKRLQNGATRTIDKLWELCSSILDQLIENACRNDFKQCGYCFTQIYPKWKRSHVSGMVVGGGTFFSRVHSE